MVKTIPIPQDEGQLTPREVEAFERAQLNETNLAGSLEISGQALKLVQGVVKENDECMWGLRRRWKAIQHMLAGNTLERGGPEDVHVPELWKAAETIVPRVEEQILERQPWFRIVPRKKANRLIAVANEALIDWQFSQAKVRNLIQPMIRDALFTQIAVFYVHWHVEKKWVTPREFVTSFDKSGRQKRAMKVSDKVEKVTYCGPKVAMIDPYDFIIDTKATDAQAATFVGHRAFMTIDQVRATGKRLGWQNIDKLDGSKPGAISGTSAEWYKYPRDPTARTQTSLDQTQPSPDGRPSKVEVVVLHTRASWNEGEDYDDYRIVILNGSIVAEVRVNPLDGQYRPYAVVRTGKSGHEFFSVGTFDNAVRLNQHADAYHQSFLAGAKLAGMPMVFAEEDSDLPDTLYRIRPGQVLKGVGAVRMTQIPDGYLKAAPLVIGMLQKDIEEVVGAFRINMGQDTGGTATEASLSLQEGNRRTRGLIRAVADGLEQLLRIFHKMNLQFSTEDVEFPVLGKRAMSLRKEIVNISPADLLDDVEFEMVGLHNTRNYGLRATGFQSVLNAGAPLIMANPNAVDTLGILHDMFDEMVGPEEADRFIKMPTPIDQLRSQVEENEALINGAEIDVDPDDDDNEHMRELHPLWQRASDPQSDMPKHVKLVVAKHWLAHEQARAKKKAQQGVLDKRMASRQQMLPPEAGGMVSPETGQSSPKRGGMSAAMEGLSEEPPGQTESENPGPPDTRKAGRTGRKNQTISQSQNDMGS